VTSESWNRIATLFGAVADLAPAERAQRLVEACPRAADVRRTVEELVMADRALGDGSFIRQVVAAAMEDVAGAREFHGR
jgi:hypothetical protein